ncbi:MAG TPA: histidine kinase dimerization/phospho-acceptor domain-containing protein [Candidatus Angelobacter sp.]|nr:histidine kinase dimerization/phospho-acceptor domain-containing protein [Candidatus Angelobacter sp.]
MPLNRKDLIAELKHGINSPLAAIRNALYLASAVSGEPEVMRYLKLADEEVSRIATILNQASQTYENTTPYLWWVESDATESAA